MPNSLNTSNTSSRQQSTGTLHSSVQSRVNVRTVSSSPGQFGRSWRRPSISALYLSAMQKDDQDIGHISHRRAHKSNREPSVRCLLFCHLSSLSTYSLLILQFKAVDALIYVSRLIINYSVTSKPPSFVMLNMNISGGENQYSFLLRKASGFGFLGFYAIIHNRETVHQMLFEENSSQYASSVLDVMATADRETCHTHDIYFPHDAVFVWMHGLPLRFHFLAICFDFQDWLPQLRPPA